MTRANAPEATVRFFTAILRAVPEHLGVGVCERGAWNEIQVVNDPQEAAAIAAEIDCRGQDAYVTPGLFTVGTSARTKEACRGLVGLTIEADVIGSPQRDGRPKEHGSRSLSEAMEVIGTVVRPSLVIGSGSGVHAWTLFKRPLLFDSDDERASADRLFRAWHEAHKAGGSKLDGSTGGLPRLLRIPGTHNYKIPHTPRPVRLLRSPGRARHFSAAELGRLVAAQLEDHSGAVPVSLTSTDELAHERHVELMRARGFARVWNALVSTFESASTRDHALAKEALRAGASEADAAGAITSKRLEEGDPKGKAHRKDYLERTIGNALAEIRTEATATVDDVVGVMRGYLHLPDTDHVVFALAVAVTAELPGDPLWGLIVGPPSSGKTEVIRGLDDWADAHVDDITVSGLLGWTGTGSKARPRGLLTRIPTESFVTVADLSTLLDMSNKGKREELYSLLRRAYDGRVVREMGGAGSEPLRWEGRLTLLAAVTPSIDNFASHSDALGPRWLYFRLAPMSAADARIATAAVRRAQPALTDHRGAVREIAHIVVRASTARARTAVLDSKLEDLLDGAARVATLGRTGVERESWGSRDILNVPQPEEPMRMAGQLAQLARALIGLNLPGAEVRRLCLKAAMDSMPEARRRMLFVLGRTNARLSTAEAARRAKLDPKVARRALGDLAAIGIAQSGDAGMGRSARWQLTGEDSSVIRSVVAVVAGAPKSAVQTHSSPNRRDASRNDARTARFGAG